ncbi:MAG: ribokinase [Actinomycetota bacterium]
MRAPTICVVGSVNLDLVATSSRLPRPGETVTGAEFARHPGGKGANQALAARRRDAVVTLIAAVGDDTLADEALELLRSEDVDLSRLVTVPDSPTGVALIAVDAVGENQIIVAPGANRRLRPEEVHAAGFDVVLCQLEVPDDAVVAAAEQATGLFCINAAPARPLPARVVDRADVIIVNEIEHEELAEPLGDFEGLLVVTLGASGAEAFRQGERVAGADSPAVDAVDAVGAGDSFCGSLVVELASGAPLPDALARACAAGAAAATRRGAQPSLPTTEDVTALLGRSGGVQEQEGRDR